MVIGEHVLESDMEMNAVKAKKLTNVRAAGSEETIKLIPPRIFSLEDAISYIRDDELVEVTPKQIRIRKRVLDKEERRRMRRDGKRS
mmetsp:Transcript_26101/g.19636  ORF Transcript_26101/g.19636 Transcript_26101/m.19636 type:complete len:87 (+) Transcript_26101:385-645(+)